MMSITKQGGWAAAALALAGVLGMGTPASADVGPEVATHIELGNVPHPYYPPAGHAPPHYAPGSAVAPDGTYAIVPAPSAIFHPIHPYHFGEHKVPPMSAYTQARVRPPAYFGMPAYYYPQSYLAPHYGLQLPVVYPYQYTPMSRAGAYYLSVYGGASAYPHN